MIFINTIVIIPSSSAKNNTYERCGCAIHFLLSTQALSQMYKLISANLREHCCYNQNILNIFRQIFTLPKLLENTVNSALERRAFCAQKNNIEIIISKHFFSLKHQNLKYNFKNNNHVLPKTGNTKYLVIILNTKLSYKYQIKKVKISIVKFRLLKRLAKVS